MNETSAREVVLLQAFESAYPPSPSWSDDDRAWATRLALQDAGAATAAPDAFIARRAHHALMRLAPREPALARWLGRRGWRPAWVGAAAVAAFGLGLFADSIGTSQRINLLAPPLWGVMLWNALVYLVLGVGLLAGLLRRRAAPGPLRRSVQRLLQRGQPAAQGGGSAAALQGFAGLWWRASAALSAARAATLLHAASAALALGFIAGLYARGLVLDYRVAWESTFLSAATAHAWLVVLLGPAASLAGIALPDAAAFDALRAVHGASLPAAPAAPWIHALALTLFGFVVLPRGLLAAAQALRARWLARHFRLPLGDAYFQRLLLQQRGDVARVTVLPYAHTPTAQAALGLRSLLAPVLGDTLQLRIAPTVAFGAEDDADLLAALPADASLLIALFDLAATPEAENQGRFVERLARSAAAAATTIVLVDEAGFVRRFGAASARLEQRRDAWRRLLIEHLSAAPVCLDLEAPTGAADVRAVQAALALPVRPTPA
jgi:hypothetical protein